jgi:predicted N-formylglutamate amidohydrolase
LTGQPLIRGTVRRERGGIMARNGRLSHPADTAARLWQARDCLIIIAPMDTISTEPAAAGGYTPYTIIEGNPASGFVLICDHAENRIPSRYGTLGLGTDALARHIAWDPGAGAVTLSLARRLGAPAVLSQFSRLLIDPNRGRDDPTLIMRLSDRAVIPGNRAIDERERMERIERYYRPYDDAIGRTIGLALATGTVPAIVSIHSFTPVWRGRGRPWQAGILWDADPRLAQPLIDQLRAEGDLVVGDNEPYSGDLADDTLYRHATQRGLAHALIELRQDLIADEEGVEAWAARLAAILAEVNRLPALHEVRQFGSRTGPVTPI